MCFFAFFFARRLDQVLGEDVRAVVPRLVVTKEASFLGVEGAGPEVGSADHFLDFLLTVSTIFALRLHVNVQLPLAILLNEVFLDPVLKDFARLLKACLDFFGRGFFLVFGLEVLREFLLRPKFLRNGDSSFRVMECIKPLLQLQQFLIEALLELLRFFPEHTVTENVSQMIVLTTGYLSFTYSSALASLQ